MKKKLISTVLLISIIISFTFIPAYADGMISAGETEIITAETQIITNDLRIIGDKDCVVFFAPTASNSPIRYQTDENGFLQGVQGFYVDNGFCYILSTSSNSVIQYKNSKQCNQLCFDSFGFTAVYFAVSGNHIFVIDSKMYLHVFKDGAILDSYFLYDAFLSEAIEDVYCVNGKLYVCINDPETMGFATYVFAFANGKIVLERDVDAMLLEGQSYSQTTTESASVNNTSAITTINNAGISITVPTEGEHVGLLYLGTNSSGETKVKTVEIINEDEDTYYFKESLKVLSAMVRLPEK